MTRWICHGNETGTQAITALGSSVTIRVVIPSLGHVWCVVVFLKKNYGYLNSAFLRNNLFISKRHWASLLVLDSLVAGVG